MIYSDLKAIYYFQRIKAKTVYLPIKPVLFYSNLLVCIKNRSVHESITNKFIKIKKNKVLFPIIHTTVKNNLKIIKMHYRGPNKEP